jgi:hypothetical protein
MHYIITFISLKAKKKVKRLVRDNLIFKCFSKISCILLKAINVKGIADVNLVFSFLKHNIQTIIPLKVKKKKE